MAIVTITVPADTEAVNYGQARMQPDGDHQLQVPDYVAKTLLGVVGVTGPTLAASAATLLAGVDQEFEANYLFIAYGQPIPASNKVSAASALITASGEPAASLN